MKCLLDTSAALALLIPRDQHHEAARRFARERGLRLETTSVIASETFTTLRGRAGYEVAMRWVRSVAESRLVSVHHMGPGEDALTWAVLERFSGVPLSYADASLVALGERLGIRSVFTFDEDFRQAGLEPVP